MKCTALFLGVLLAAIVVPARAGIFSDQEGMSEKCFKRHSRAWCTWDAAYSAGDRLKDIPKDKLGDGVVGAERAGGGGGVSTLLDLTVIGATAGGLMRAAPGFSGGGDAAMWALGLLFSGDGPLPIVGRSQVFGWMPIELAATSEDAHKLFLEMILDATKKALPGCAFVDITLSSPPNGGAYSLRRQDQKGYLLTGEGCALSGRTLTQRRSIGESFTEGLPPKNGVAPEWLGGYKAWVFGSFGGVGRLTVLELSEGAEYASWRYVPEMSKHLPRWAFVTLSAENRNLGVQMNTGLKLSLLYNEGKAMAPIFPDVELVDPLKHMGAAK